MMILDSDAQSQNNQKTTFLFGKGAEVEVSSDEDGFKGAWYPATIVDSTTPRSSSKKRKKTRIQYKTLVTEDGSTPLLEYVDWGNIRPLPPVDPGSGGHVFGENDAVDARYRDGWWSGVVTKVLEGSRYRVYFDNPPDVMDFNGNDLRFHLEWVNGKWEQPQKKQIAGSFFSPGTAVEVNVEQEGICDAWFPAVVIKENEDNTFFVKYQNSMNNDEAGIAKAVVDSLHIRPTPPCYAVRNFELLDKVDAQYNLAWRPGLIIKLLAGKRYNVVFKQGNEDRELEHSEIRPHVEWIDGKWITKSKEMMFSEHQGEIVNAQRGSENPEVVHQLEGPGADDNKTGDKKPSMNIKDLKEQPIHSNEKPSSFTLSPSKKKMKIAAFNGNDGRSRPSKTGDAVEVPLSFAAWQLGKMPIDSSTKGTLSAVATTKAEGKRARYSRKPVISDQPSAKTKSHSTEKTVKIKQRRFVGRDSEKVDIITRKGRVTKSPFNSPLALVAVREINAVDAIAEKINQSESKTKEPEPPMILGLHASELRSLRSECPGQIYDEASLKLMGDEKKNLLDSVAEKTMELDLPRSGNSQRRKRGRPKKLVIMGPMALEAGEVHGYENVAEESNEKDDTTEDVELSLQRGVKFTDMRDVEPENSSRTLFSHDAPREGTLEISGIDIATKGTDINITGMSKNVADDDQPLSTWLGGMHSSTGLSSARSTNGFNETRDRQNIATESPAVDAKGNSSPIGNESLPFVKRSPIWKTIESMEVFQIVPQKPHFRPLAECRQEYREGSAVGMMVTFASLFEKISSLRLDDSRSIFESTLESLNDLEKHGFDVFIPRGRANKLLSIKDSREKLLNELKGAERQIMDHTDERKKLDERVSDIEKKIKELQEQLTASKSKMEAKDREIAKLQSHVYAMNVHIKSSRNDFEKVATAPWESS